MGDLNTRFDTGVQSFLLHSVVPGSDYFTYAAIPDQGNIHNRNENDMATVCRERNLVVVPNLKCGKKYHKSNLTYMKGNEWISEVDVCIASYKAVSCIESFNVNNYLGLP